MLLNCLTTNINDNKLRLAQKSEAMFKSEAVNLDKKFQVYFQWTHTFLLFIHSVWILVRPTV